MSDVSAPRPVPNRYLALSFPRLSTDRIRRERMGRSWRSDAPRKGAADGGDGESGRPAPLALYETVGNANRIVATCEAAEAMGLAAGSGLAEAKARFPDTEVMLADPAADRRLLEAVADWCDRYTPLVALDAPHGLVLDISGCAHLFGGEKALMDDLLVRLFHQGLAALAAIASHAGTALALVGGGRGRGGAIISENDELAAVSPLPVAALRLEPPWGQPPAPSLGTLAAGPAMGQSPESRSRLASMTGSVSR